MVSFFKWGVNGDKTLVCASENQNFVAKSLTK
jgi:hypothetical protein